MSQRVLFLRLCTTRPSPHKMRPTGYAAPMGTRQHHRLEPAKPERSLPRKGGKAPVSFGRAAASSPPHREAKKGSCKRVCALCAVPTCHSCGCSSASPTFGEWGTEGWREDNAVLPTPSVTTSLPGLGVGMPPFSVASAKPAASVFAADSLGSADAVSKGRPAYGGNIGRHLEREGRMVRGVWEGGVLEIRLSRGKFLYDASTDI